MDYCMVLRLHLRFIMKSPFTVLIHRAAVAMEQKTA